MVNDPDEDAEVVSTVVFFRTMLIGTAASLRVVPSKLAAENPIEPPMITGSVVPPFVAPSTSSAGVPDAAEEADSVVAVVVSVADAVAVPPLWDADRFTESPALTGNRNEARPAEADTNSIKEPLRHWIWSSAPAGDWATLDTGGDGESQMVTPEFSPEDALEQVAAGTTRVVDTEAGDPGVEFSNPATALLGSLGGFGVCAPATVAPTVSAAGTPTAKAAPTSAVLTSFVCMSRFSIRSNPDAVIYPIPPATATPNSGPTRGRSPARLPPLR
jgi:hypothetical protein